MLEQIKGDWWRGVLESDPVRPHIPIDFRLTDNRESYVLSENGVDADAAICIAYTDDVAVSEDDLTNKGNNVAMLYTVWSHKHGAGRVIVNEIFDHLTQNTNVNRIVTLSPLTKMAKRFHLNNGAFELQVNKDTVNFEYPI